MPFLTEEIWQYIAKRTPEEALIIAKYPTIENYNEQLISDFEKVKEVVSGIRTIRKEKNISFKDEIELSLLNNENLSSIYDSIIMKMGNISKMEIVNDSVEGALTFRVLSNEYFVPIAGAIDIEEEIKKMKADAEANAESDKKAREIADKINGADSMIFQTESQLKEFGDKLSADKKGPIEAALAELKKAHESKDIAQIDAAMEKINEAWKVASEEMYKAQQGAGEPTGAPQEEPANAGGSDDVEDVDFEEVK